MSNIGFKLSGIHHSQVSIFEGLQNPTPEGLDYWYEFRVDRIIAVSIDEKYSCTNQEPILDHKILTFEPKARWSEIRGDRKCRCRILSEREIRRLFASL